MEIIGVWLGSHLIEILGLISIGAIIGKLLDFFLFSRARRNSNIKDESNFWFEEFNKLKDSYAELSKQMINLQESVLKQQEELSKLKLELEGKGEKLKSIEDFFFSFVRVNLPQKIQEIQREYKEKFPS